MNIYLKAVADKQGAVVSRQQALNAGYTSDDIRDLRQRKVWTSIRRGVYVETDRLNAMTDIDRHSALVYATTLNLARPAVVSHASAAVIRGLPTWGINLDEVHVSRADIHSGRREAGVHHHIGELPDNEIEVVDGLRVTSPARTVLDIARTAKFEPALCIADAAFHEEPDAHELARKRLEEIRDWKGASTAGSVVAAADGRSESVGESRTRILIQRVGLPAPELQVEIFNDLGTLVGRCDFGWKELCTLGEFDGKVKYSQYLRPGEEPADVVWREKQREDRLRALGFEIVRIVWADLENPWAVARRIHDAFERGRRRGAAQATALSGRR